ncbi:uncharacterized protein BO97DRAFT_409521 [Aspergillus homomorphus CBS 101889]|uniref:Transferase family protein n=1 Tax=Aspergillus homomorphus (strain CBS 101889) TaxID=1450537 RepID=A0A395HHI3_ASPHC|nr:hypothetical protein BO97DRAFT_409521 [Aspergillus homomorphus CBS 101889]RAL06625.1 hypothetical protein BO97DRAFT_409521 [Aspergillus homomorphus CBS 101889]
MSSEIVHVPLNALDHLHRPNYVKLCYYLPLQPGAKPIDVFEDLGKGLHKTFVQVPWLGGKVFRQSPDAAGYLPGQRELRYKPAAAAPVDGPLPHQLRFNELESDYTFAELREEGFPSDAYDDQELLSVPIEGNLDTGCDVFVAQANFIPDGCVLCMSTCHAAIDGTAMVTVMKLWADNCRSLYDANEPVEPFPAESSDRTLLDKLWIPPKGGASLQDADAWTRGLVGLRPSEGSTTPIDFQNWFGNDHPNPPRLMKNRTFYMSAANMTALQKECEEATSEEGANTGPLSGNDVVTALMWRSLVRARAAAADDTLDEESVLESAIDGRMEFSQSVPPSYLGNITFYNQSAIPVADLLDPAVPLGRVARAIRAGAGRVNSASLHHAYALIKGVADYAQLKPRFRRTAGADMLISNLLLFPVDEIRFGTQKFGNEGRAEAVRCFNGPFNHVARISFILPRRSKGGIELAMNLFEEEMDCLLEDDEFNRFCLEL